MKKQNKKTTTYSFLLAVMALLIFTGCEKEAPPLPDLPEPNEPVQPVEPVEPVSTSNVYRYGEQMPVAGSESQLIRTENGISVTFKTPDVIVGHQYSVWMVIINQTEACSETPCNKNDMFNPETQSDVLPVAVTVADEKGVFLSGTRKTGDTEGSAMPDLNALFGLNTPSVGILKPLTADIQLILRSHGPVGNTGAITLGDLDWTCGLMLDPPDVPTQEDECGHTHYSIHSEG